MGTSEEGLEGVVRAARALRRELAPLASRAATELAGAYEREVWPGGAPAVVTWLGLLERNLARLDEQTDGLVELDVREAQARGAAPDSSSVRAETALRVQLNHQLQEEIRKAKPRSTIDLLVFPRDEPMPESLSLQELVEETVAALEDYDARFDDPEDAHRRRELALFLALVLGELVSHLRAMASMFGATELHQTLEVHLARTRALVARAEV